MTTLMAKDKNTIVSEIVAYVTKNGGRYSEWYAGIATNPRDRLFKDHAVREGSDAWIYQQCANSDAAREIEKAFFNVGMRGGPGGGDHATDFIYAYKIGNHTIE
jgi:hypothetical protein